MEKVKIDWFDAFKPLINQEWKRQQTEKKRNRLTLI